MNQFKVIRHTVTNDPIYIMYKNQVVLNLQSNSLINSVFVDALVNKLNKTLLADQKFEDTLKFYDDNKRALMGILEVHNED